MAEPTSNATLEKIDQWQGFIERILVYVTSFVLVVLTGMIVLDVFLRFFFNAPLPASVESTELMMPYIVFLPLAYTLRMEKHVRISLFMSKGSPRFRGILEVFCRAVALLFCSMLTYTGWMLFWESFRIREEMLAIVKLPWWVGKFAMPVGFLFLALGYLARLLYTFMRQNNGLHQGD